MSKHYRALISIPIAAENDNEAIQRAEAQAGSLHSGHLELLGEVQKNGMLFHRVVHADPHLKNQLPLDWKA